MVLPGLNFHASTGIQEAIQHRYGQPVIFFLALGFKEFYLVVSFDHCKFQFSESSVGFLLQATLGGVAADFRLQRITDRGVQIRCGF
jgi:hypothetical protein